MSIDDIGHQGNGYVADEVRIAFLIQHGYINQVMMSMDIGAKQFLLSYRGHGSRT